MLVNPTAFPQEDLQCCPSAKFVSKMPTPLSWRPVATSTAATASRSGCQAPTPQTRPVRPANVGWRKKNFRNWRLLSAAFVTTSQSFRSWQDPALCPAGPAASKVSPTNQSLPSTELATNLRTKKIRQFHRGQCRSPKWPSRWLTNPAMSPSAKVHSEVMKNPVVTLILAACAYSSAVSSSSASCYFSQWLLTLDLC